MLMLSGLTTASHRDCEHKWRQRAVTEQHSTWVLRKVGPCVVVRLETHEEANSATMDG